MTNNTINNVTDYDFEDKVLHSEQPVLVDFWAEWCAPCRSIEPYLSELASEYEGKVTFVKIDVDKNHAYASAYGVKNMPTFILFKDGQQTNLLTGLSLTKIKELVERA